MTPKPAVPTPRRDTAVDTLERISPFSPHADEIPEAGHFCWEPGDVIITPPAPNAAINQIIRRRARP